MFVILRVQRDHPPPPGFVRGVHDPVLDRIEFLPTGGVPGYHSDTASNDLPPGFRFDKFFEFHMKDEVPAEFRNQQVLLEYWDSLLCGPELSDSDGED